MPTFLPPSPPDRGYRSIHAGNTLVEASGKGGAMTRSAETMRELLRELAEVRELGKMTADPAVAEASLAVARAIGTLNQLSRQRPAEHPGCWDELVEATVAQARMAVAMAKTAVVRLPATQPAPALTGLEAANPMPLILAACCEACGRSFDVQYASRNTGSLVVFLIACPWDDCNSVTEILCPADSYHLIAARRADGQSPRRHGADSAGRDDSE